jgi:hypothetical protein
MDAAELRATQAPIKDRYKTDPKTAMITLKAKGSIENEGIACKVETGRALAVAGLHPATGGSGLELCSGDMRWKRWSPARGDVGRGDRDRGATEDRLVTAEGDLIFAARRRRQGGPGQFCGSPSPFRRRYVSAAGQARSAAATDRTLLRGLPDHQERPQGFGDDASGVRQYPFTLPWRGRVDARITRGGAG